MKTTQTKAYKKMAAKCQGLSEFALVTLLADISAAIKVAKNERAERELFHGLFAVEDQLKAFGRSAA